MFDDIGSATDAPRLPIHPMADEKTSTLLYQCVHGSGPCTTLGGVAGGRVHHYCYGEDSVKCVVVGIKHNNVILNINSC